jgi:hypothetical protein
MRQKTLMNRDCGTTKDDRFQPSFEMPTIFTPKPGEKTCSDRLRRGPASPAFPFGGFEQPFLSAVISKDEWTKEIFPRFAKKSSSSIGQFFCGSTHAYPEPKISSMKHAMSMKKIIF